MPFIQEKCTVCHKVAQTDKEYTVAGSIYRVLKCGHVTKSEGITNCSGPEHLESLDKKRLLPYQVEGVQFFLKSGGRALIADEMGLGKTVQALGSLAVNEKELLPALIVVKSSTKSQWQREFTRWIGEESFAQVIESSNDFFLPLKAWIISYDLIPRMKQFDEKVKALGVKTIILDECQQIKNTQANRSIAIRNICKVIPNVIALSGTPIKNSAAEYFCILNILRPSMFPNESKFLYNECDSYYTGYKYKTGGLRYPQEFQRKTENFIIRREREEVMPQLPRISRNYQFCDLADQVKQAYLDTFQEFRDEYNEMGDDMSFSDSSNILAYLTKMRHLTGLSKIEPASDFALEFIEETERLLTIFVHHKDVGELLAIRLEAEMEKLGLPGPLKLTAELNTEQRQTVIDKFLRGEHRILIASTLAAGEGLNLQKCSDCIMLERQWNPANEEQAEGRFIRIGQQASAVTATYFVAIGTVDEFFAEIVEQKREIVSKTLSGEAAPWDQSSLMKELAEVLATKGGQKWSI